MMRIFVIWDDLGIRSNAVPSNRERCAREYADPPPIRLSNPRGNSYLASTVIT